MKIVSLDKVVIRKYVGRIKASRKATIKGFLKLNGKPESP